MAGRNPPGLYSDFYEENGGYEIPVTRSRSKPIEEEASSNIYDLPEDAVSDEHKQIKVSGYSAKCTKDHLENFFENRGKFGRQSSVEVDMHSSYAVITFKGAGDAANVIDVHQKKPCIEHNHELVIEYYNPSNEAEREQETKTIEVRGFSPNTSDDAIKYYFEAQRSDGGMVESFTMDNDRTLACVTFKENGVVERVMQRDHKIGGCKLRLKKFIMSKTDLLLSDISSDATEDSIWNYCEAKFKQDVQSVIFSEDRTKALVICAEPFDFKKVSTSCSQHSLHQCYMTPHPVQITDSIIIINVSDDFSKDALWFYFENVVKSRGGEVVYVKLEDGYCVVTFKDPKVVHSVCSQDKHYLNERLLKVSPYQSCLGLPASNEMPQSTFPDPVILDSLKPPKLKFLKKSETQKNQFSHNLKKHYAVVSWDGLFPKIDCVITSSVKGYRKIVKSWKENVKQVVNDFDASCDIREFPITPEELTDVKNELEKVQIVDSESVAVQISSKDGVINILALKDSVNENIQQIQEAINKAKVICKRRKERKTERKHYDSWKTKFLKAVGFSEKMKQRHDEDVDIEINTESSEVIVSGPQKLVKQILLEAFEVIDQLHERRIQMDSSKIRLLSRKETAEKINRQMRDKGLCDIWEIKSSDVWVHAEDNIDLRRMENVIESMLTQITVDIEKNAKRLLGSKEWDELESTLDEECSGCIIIEKTENKVIVNTITEHEDNVDKKVKHFFSKNATYREEVTLEENVVKFIERHMKQDLDSAMKSVGKKLKYDLHKSKVTIEGPADQIKAAKVKVKNIESEVKRKLHTFNKRGIYRYMSSEKGRQSIQGVESSASCIIDVMGKGLGSSLGKDQKKRMARNFDKPTYCAECFVKTGQKVIVHGGDMITLQVDVLVNASNKDMQHVGGLAAAILKQGGPEIEKECHDYIQKNGSLSTCDVFMSKAGKLKVAAIAHVVGPVWHDGKQNEKKNLELAIRNCMKEAETGNHRSIAFPALSAGMFGYPVDQACTVIASTIKAYFKDEPKSIIKEVYLCDITIKTVEAFVDAVKSTFKQCKILVELGSLKGKDKRQAWLTESGASQDQDSTSTSPFGNITVKIVKGEMIKEKVDVIVNSASPDLQLKKGQSSGALLQKAGSKIQEECTNNYPNGIQPGEVAVTSGGKLNCQHVFHVALENYRHHKTMHPLQGLKKSMMECLTQADKKGFTSISFPAMGTGAQGYPRDKVASEMFSTVANFYRNNQGTRLTSVRFIIYYKDDETFQAFVVEDRHWVGGGDSRDVQGSSTSSLAKVVKVKRGYGEFEIGSVKVKVYQGDITDEDVVAIVASSNRDLDLSKGKVSQAIIQKGGTEIQQDCETQKSEMRKKGLTVTTAGQLKSKYIIHTEAKKNPSEWKPMILKCLEVAEKKRFSSIAFPALGTTFGCKPQEISRILAEALLSFGHESPQHVRKVCVVVFQREMIELFIEGIKSTFQSASGPSSSRPSSSKKHHDKKKESSHDGNQSTEPDMDDFCSLTVYGRNDRDINTAIQQLKAHIKNDWIEKPIRESSIAQLKKSKVGEIKESGRTNHVLVDIDWNRGVITLTGSPVNIITVSDKVNKIIHAFDISVHEKQLAKIVTNVTKWVYIKGNKSYPFPDRENLTIETAFSNKEQKVRIKDHSGGEYEINFKDMNEWDIKKPNDKFPVIRKDLIKEVGHETPKHWIVMSEGQQMLTVPLKSSDKEYKDVEQDFLKSLGRVPKISKIERIQNPTLYTQYAAKKRQMDSSNPKRKNEKVLWHGTDIGAVNSINNHGFNRSYCGKNATALGAGVYFAVNSSYSDQGTYTPVDANGFKHMYRTRVLTGEYIAGNSGLRTPPVKDPAQPHILYDSVTNSPSNPMMFVIFHDTQAYPEHIITYQ